jgi:DNA mismatch endonuclease (patch repair protein)
MQRLSKKRDTGPELALRRQLHRLGLRYRVDAAPLPGLRRRADIVFRPVRIAVFLDGCFWHGCPDHGSQPRTNRAWWKAKLSRTRARDRDTDRRLREAGWRPIRIWEHENPALAAERIHSIVLGARDG